MTFKSRVVDVLSEWGSLYVLLQDGRVSTCAYSVSTCAYSVSTRAYSVSTCANPNSQLIRLDENDTKTKLETLFKKNLYPTAIK